jgi:spore coat protein H
VAVFGMGAEADWLLNGSWLDRSLVRNKLGYDLHRAMGRWAPDSRFAELTLDGQYLGVFLLVERIEHGGTRLDIADDDGTGRSFIVKGSDSGQFPSTVQHNPWEEVYPEPAPAGVGSRLAAFESAILAGGDAMFDSQVDLDSLVDFVILEETIKNNDAYWLSHNVYASAGGKVGFIPWDLDLGLGQPGYNDSERTDGWLFYRPALIAQPAMTPAFRARLAARWAELRGSLLATDALIARLHGYRAFLGEAIGRNWQVWDITGVGGGTFPLYPVASPDEEYAHIDAWLGARLLWIDASIATY